jgi:pimeloyl-ACP methyl ester carboxylesterase
MPINAVSTYLKYANLQMAAEAILPVGFTGSIPVAELTQGNERNSAFTDVLANQFIADGWTVEAHQANTSTGFSGTLFKNTQTNELVLSFRSTEFVDDAARDSQATNSMEVKEYGWAFGQIADMEAWYTTLKASGRLGGAQPFSVTGYSLGAHLATAFNLLHPQDAAATYTFNGAGVGDIKAGFTLAQIVNLFQQRRTQGNSAEFTTSRGIAIYQELLTTMNNPGSSAAIATAMGSVTQPRSTLRLRSQRTPCCSGERLQK